MSRVQASRRCVRGAVAKKSQSGHKRYPTGLEKMGLGWVGGPVIPNLRRYDDWRCRDKERRYSLHLQVPPQKVRLEARKRHGWNSPVPAML